VQTHPTDRASWYGNNNENTLPQLGVGGCDGLGQCHELHREGRWGQLHPIQACATQPLLGTLHGFYAGTYNETPSISRSGTGSSGICTACITFTVNPGDTVTTQPWNVTASYVIVRGFTITDPTFTKGTAGVFLHGGDTGVQILNNTITQVGFANPGQTSSGYPCVQSEIAGIHYVTIKGNTMSWCSALASEMNVAGGNAHISGGIAFTGDHILIQNNDISHTNSAAIVGSGSTFSALIGNTWHDSYIGSVDGAPPNGEHDALGCIVTNNCNTHLNFSGAFGGTTTNILFENNTSSNIWGTQGAHTWFASSATATMSLWISRFNKMYQVGSDYLSNQAFTSNPDGVTYWKDYNNSFIVSGQQTTSNVFASCEKNAANGSFLNNLFYNDVNPPGTKRGYYLWASACLPVNSGHNLAFDSSCTAGTLAGCTTGQMATDSGNIYADPKLVATDGSSFDLQPGSPALNAGAYLTTVAPGDSGSGTSLVVKDASYFQDHFGISGVNADCISVTTAGNHVCITAVNYSTNTLTLANSVTRSSGDPVWLYSDSTGRIVLVGSAPNIGAGFYPPSGSGPSAPTGLAGSGPAVPTGLAAVVQ
jgi:hypothetical protein